MWACFFSVLILASRDSVNLLRSIASSSHRHLSATKRLNQEAVYFERKGIFFFSSRSTIFAKDVVIELQIIKPSTRSMTTTGNNRITLFRKKKQKQMRSALVSGKVSDEIPLAQMQSTLTVWQTNSINVTIAAWPSRHRKKCIWISVFTREKKPKSTKSWNNVEIPFLFQFRQNEYFSVKTIAKRNGIQFTGQILHFFIKEKRTQQKKKFDIHSTKKTMWNPKRNREKIRTKTRSMNGIARAEHP